MGCNLFGNDPVFTLVELFQAWCSNTTVQFATVNPLRDNSIQLNRVSVPPTPPPLQANVAPPLGPKSGEEHSLAVERPNLDDWTESLALCIL